MIVVIADDLTGAAELGGIALRHGLDAEVQTEFMPEVEVDVIVVDTDSRWDTADNAGEKAARLAEQVQQTSPKLVYKKTDSVLRGNVLTELTAVMQGLGLTRTVLVPCNPSMGRTIVGGRYFINGQPIEKTDFANDPKHPKRSSDVLQMLDADDTTSTGIASSPTAVSDRDIIVGEAVSNADIRTWAQCVEGNTLPAGGADFFDAILTERGYGLAQGRSDLREFSIRRTLVVCGSTSTASWSAIESFPQQGLPVVHIPDGLFRKDRDPARLLAQWTEDVCGLFKRHTIVVAALQKSGRDDPELPIWLARCQGQLVEMVLARANVDHLCIEGGATASAVVRHLGWKRFVVCDESAPGVVTMNVTARGLELTIKPGSYPWPSGLWGNIETVNSGGG